MIVADGPGSKAAERPRISVVTVCFNSERTIGQTLESVRSQTYPNVEHIVVDGGSTDGTLGIIKQYESPLLKWVSANDRGMYDAMNKGIALATGSWVGILNSDDWLEPTAMADVVGCLESSGADYTFGDVYLSDSAGVRFGIMQSIAPDAMGRRFLYKMPITHQTCYVSREFLDKVGPYSLEYALSADHDFVIRLIASGARGAALPRTIASYRMGGLGGSRRTFRESRDIAIRHGMSSLMAHMHYWSSLAKISVVRILPPRLMRAMLRLKRSRHVWY